jgi:hypothetical protein
MTNRPRQRSSMLGPSDNIPEMDADDCRKLLREHFGVHSEYVEGSTYLYRFIGGSLNEFVPDCPARTIPAHAKGTRFSPLCIKCLLDKFEIGEDLFRSAYNVFYGAPPTDEPPQPNARIN